MLMHTIALALLLDPPAADQLVEHTETVKLLGPGVGGGLLLVLGQMVIRHKWPKVKTKTAELDSYHATMRGATQATHETIRVISSEHHETMRRALGTIDRLVNRDGPPSRPPGEPGSSSGGGAA